MRKVASLCIIAFFGIFARPILKIGQPVEVAAQEMWSKDRGRVEKGTSLLSEALEKTFPTGRESAALQPVFVDAYRQFKQSFDSEQGGFGSAPKFPQTGNISLLLRMHRRSGDKLALQIALHSLRQMSLGGIFDHLGGGFHRYSTDSAWRLPHFEKMLYDNALLTVSLLEAYQVSGEKLFAQTARKTLDYLLREMTGQEGGFYSAQDAGDVGKEGEYYAWREKELRQVLTPPEYREFSAVFDLSKENTFEHGYVLALKSDKAFASLGTKPVSELAARLYQKRSKRQRELRTDDKILAAWNGLAISALVAGYQVLGDTKYLAAAEKAANFALAKLVRDGSLQRRWRDNESKYPGYLDDYSFFIQGLIGLHQVTFEDKWLTKALLLQQKQDELFWDSQGGGYFYTDNSDKTLIIRRKDYQDGAIPSGNAVALHNLIRLSELTADGQLRQKAEELVQLSVVHAKRNPAAYAYTLIAYDYFADISKEIAIIGPADSPTGNKFVAELRRVFQPNAVLLRGPGAGLNDTKALAIMRGKRMIGQQTTFYVCQNQTCKMPTTDLKTALEMANTFSSLSLAP